MWHETQSVVFITTPGADGEHEPIGTGFLIHTTETVGDKFFLGYHIYLVTAAHVVRGNQSESFMRVRRVGGAGHDQSVDDIHVPSWWYHSDPGIDIAVAPVNLSLDEFDLKSNPAPRPDDGERRFIRGSIGDLIGPGDDVFLVGLLGNVPEMGKRNIPLVRSGTLGAVWQDRVPMKLPDGTQLSGLAHLIDANSHAGFSGSPCFVRRSQLVGERQGLDERVTRRDFEREESTTLIGIIRGHFPHGEFVNIASQGEVIGSATVPLNSGVAIVTPAPFIGDILMSTELVKDREEKRLELRNRLEREETHPQPKAD